MTKRYAGKVGAPATAASLGVPTILIAFVVAGCSSLLPNQESIVEGPWHSFQEAQQTFDKIIPYKTTVQDLQQLKLDPGSNPNVITPTCSAGSSQARPSTDSSWKKVCMTASSQMQPAKDMSWNTNP